MNLFAVFKHGIYRHECAGIFSDLEKAKQVADALADTGDRYHHYNIVKFTLDHQTLSAMPFEHERFTDADLFEPKPIYTTKNDEAKGDTSSRTKADV